MNKLTKHKYVCLYVTKGIIAISLMLLFIMNGCSQIDNALGSPRQKELDRKRRECQQTIFTFSKAAAVADQKKNKVEQDIATLTLYINFVGMCRHKTVNENALAE